MVFFPSISVSVVEEELFDRNDGERLVKINLNSPSTDASVLDGNNCYSRKNESAYSKSALKMSNSTDSCCLQYSFEKTRSVGFKLDKECQTDSCQEQRPKYTSVTSQTSTDDEDITSRCSCFDDNNSVISRTPIQVNGNGYFHEDQNLQYIDSNQDDVPNELELQRGFD